MIKKSDLRSVFGRPTQSDPLYFHDDTRTNQQVGSLNAKKLKSPILICAHCNNTRTQPHDFAWAHMSDWLRHRNPPIHAGAIVRGNRIFPYCTAKQMLNVHLFFLKQFGGLIEEAGGKITIDVRPFASAILKGCHHPNVYLQFAHGPFVDGKPVTGRSDFHGLKLNNGTCVLGMWFYQVEGLTVNVIYADPNEDWRNLDLAWHPRLGSNRITLGNFSDDIEGHYN